jgi:cardiolipin synthase C
VSLNSRWFLLAVALLSSGCALTPEQFEQADRTVAAHRGLIGLPMPQPTTPADELDRLELGADRHHLLIVDQGSDALALRLHLIRTARDEILLQNYIFHDDSAGSLLLIEMLQAAQRGVRVRLLVDSLFSLPQPRLQAALEMAHEHFELRLYNPIFERAVLHDAGFLRAIFCCFRGLNHRMHNKLLVVDRKHGLIGGRNTADRYFDLDTRMNFSDMEVLVSGPVVGQMIEGFDRYWDHRRTRAPRHTRDVMAELLENPPAGLSLLAPQRLRFASELANSPTWLAQLLNDHGHYVEQIQYFTDPPDKPWKLDQLGVTDSTAVLHDLMASAREQIVLQTPYFVMSPRLESVLANRADSVGITVSTNSLAATDAFPVHAHSRRQRQRMVGALDIRLFEAKPFPADRHRLINRYPDLIRDRAAGISSPMRGDPAPATVDMPGPRISLHAKILVVDQLATAVTSHNFDPRSEIYNTENGIIVHDPEFARTMSSYIELMTKPRNAWRVAEKPTGPPLLGGLNRGLARASRRLPLLDIWPWYLTENYQLPSGTESVEPHHPDFHQTWVPVGLAPEVVGGQRRFMTSVISRMFGFMWRIM